MDNDAPPPAYLGTRPRRYAKMTGLPARIRLDVEPVRIGSTIFLDFPVEPYDVPEEGGSVVPFWKPEEDPSL